MILIIQQIADISSCSLTPESVCSGEPGDSQCSCECGQGFETSTTNVGVQCTSKINSIYEILL